VEEGHAHTVAFSGEGGQSFSSNLYSGNSKFEQ